jgi:hypothetical protein
MWSNLGSLNASKVDFGTKNKISEITKYTNAGKSLDKTATNFGQNPKP